MFSADAKDAVARVRFERACCPAALLRALSRFSGGSASSLVVSTQRGSIARAALHAAKLAGVGAAASSRRSARLGPRTLIDVRAGAPVAGGSGIPARSCCRRAWLRGAFLACGSVTDPARSYHLEFFCPDDAAAQSVCDVLATFDIDAGVSRRRGRALAYVKGAGSVADVLGQMGASQAVFALDNVRALRQIKNAIRRAVNSESANAARAAASSARQRAAALRAIKKVGLGALRVTLAQAAQLRIAHPDLTLAELAARARPRVTKSTMGYRMRMLEQIAKFTRRRRVA